MQLKTSIKHLQIDKANNMMLIVVAVATVVTVFSLVSAKALLAQSSYQRKVIGEKTKAVKQLKSSISAANTLKGQYEVFEKADPNIIGGKGGTSPGEGPRDGDNARIVLDALPNQYDFPALTSSIEKIANDDHIPLQSVGGTDVGGQSASSTTSSNKGGGQSQPTPIPFSISTRADYGTVLVLLKDLERSIRPIDITQFTLSGAANSMTASIQTNTYYQLPVSLQVGEKVVK
jgi:hypothetical protein